MTAPAEPRVLVADDDADIRAVVADMLDEELGVPTAQAGDGREALELTRALRPAIVLTDIDMPVLDGLGLARRLKADPATREIPVIGLSAAERGAAALAAGCDDFVPKPFDFATLCRAVTRWLE